MKLNKFNNCSEEASGVINSLVLILLIGDKLEVIMFRRMYSSDFNVVETNQNGEFVRVSEINAMIDCGALTVNRGKLEEYHNRTRIFSVLLSHKCNKQF